MITVTGASGQLGRLVVTGLLDAGVPAGEVVAVVRTPEKAADLAARGVQVRQAEYGDPASLQTALQGTDRLLLVSGSEVGQRVTQHGNVLRAARAAGVELVVYTSAPKADDTSLPLAPEHAATERLIAEVGVPAVVLRNNWYLENYDQQIRTAAETGEVAGSSGAGRIAAATRADFAAGAVAVLTAAAPRPGVLELGGDQAFTLADLAGVVAAQTGRDVTYRDLTAEEHVQSLLGQGLPQETAEFIVGLDRSIAQGALDTGSTALSELIGRPTTPLAEHVRTVLAG
ncbi:SDR family oxidoreductase [Modestobacter marinus]|uniref:NAD(P)-dependent oxidoreductase n=1 Tax=Modestobacter marinus TaxID=477641 RepID=A0A846LRR8_9ACTN|nr:SDR family oxidoreductase [Modestobacter marinus]NIH68108.1 NAD(P)H dehydrogenase (quinone) [Modestobacter marinus]GGL80267.1 NAD(P)-dependent oxidoreductase [Modestobacter marinus]